MFRPKCITREIEYNGIKILCSTIITDNAFIVNKRKEYIILKELPLTTFVQKGRIQNSGENLSGYAVFKRLKDCKEFIDGVLVQ